MSPDLLPRIEACIPGLRRYALALLRAGDEEADDLVQTCLLRALERPPDRLPDADVRPWLFTVLHNTWASGRRRARVRGVPAGLDEAEEAGATAVRARQEGDVEAHELLRGLGVLADEQRAVLLLVAVEGLTYAEVAAVLGVPMGTVMSRLSRARERLRLYMDGTDRPGAGPATAPAVPRGRPLLRRVK